MELAAKNKRSPRLALILLVIIVGLTSCARATSSRAGAGDRAIGADTVTLNTETAPALGDELPQVDLSSSSTRLLSKPTSRNVGIELVEAKDINQLVVRANVSSSDVSMTRLSNPERLVVDLPATVGSPLKTATYDTQDAQFVSRIRVGAHPDKTRIVMDLPGNANAIHSKISNQEGAVVVNLYTTGTASDVVPAAEIMTEPKAAPKPEMLAEEFKSEPVVESGVVESDATAKTLDAQPVSMKPMLKEARFETVGPKQNELVLDMESAGFYTLKKTAPSEYVLDLEDAVLAPSIASTVVAKPGSGKIRSARVTEKDGSTQLRIFAAPEATLRAESRGGGIVVSVGENSYAADPRAQFAPEATEGKAEVKVEATPAAADNTTAASTEGAAEEDKELNALIEDQTYHGRLISLDLQDTDIDNALRIIAEVSNLNIVTTEDVAGKVTLRLIDVPWDQALDVILKINSLGKVQEGNVIRIAPLEKLRSEREALKQAKIAEEQLEELKVRYIRISYARASDLKPLVDNVVSERGSTTYDERSNQIIVKDTKAGLSRVVELVRKLDLRTPQVLLETQIVESKKGFVRQLGAQLGFRFSQSPTTGNATGWNFPNSIVGSANSNNLGTLTSASPGFMDIMFGSADGTRNLSVQLAAAENEGIAKVVSRPSVATTNNKQATIKSITKLRVKLPSGGSSVTVGQGAQGTGSNTATESIEAGIVLEVTPQASPDYYVLLDINAKSSSFDRSSNVDGIPSEVERSATSTILVSSGQTFVMGGIYKITENVNLTGIPFLKDLPFLGHAFRFSSVDDTDEELLFFITPRIIEGSFDDAAMKATL